MSAPKGVPWTPVHDYGCGWVDCPECGPIIEVEILAKHERMRDRTIPGSPDEAALVRLPRLVTPAVRRAARAARDRVREKARVRRALGESARAEAEALLAKRPVRRQLLRDGRSAWESEVWLELLNPSKLVARREKGFTLEAKVAKAVKRAEKRIWIESRERARYLPVTEPQ